MCAERHERCGRCGGPSGGGLALCCACNLLPCDGCGELKAKLPCGGEWLCRACSRRGHDYGRAVRLNLIRDAFNAGARLTKDELAARYDVSTRTIERDILDLETTMAVPLRRNKQGRWQKAKLG